jgi:fructuronate reductase/mannitol 2-dehydrogenase
MHLSDHSLPRLSRRVSTPAYDRRALRASIVHIGVGGFHRAHQAVYLDALAREGNLEWGETGVGLNSSALKAALGPQDGLYTVVERASEAESAAVIGVMKDYHFAPDDPQTVLARLADPATRIVTLTITGEGYNLDSDGEFRVDEAAVRRDAQALESPRTWFGYVVAALARRRAEGMGGLTVLSCDNLANSGAAAETAVVSFARTVDETLARWVERNVSFPQSMVDRITPSSDEGTSRLVQSRFGVVDRAPVLTEPFKQWVVEDDFASGRPPLEDVGVQFVSDVAPYKLMKSRLLNGTHSAMAYLGYLAGHRTTAELVKDPVMRTYLARMMRDEMAPLLPRVPGVDLDDYQATLLQRFANENIGDALSRLCGRGSTKVPAYLLPSLVEARRAGHPAPLLTLAVAGWFRYLRASDLTGAPIEIQDVRRDRLVALARSGGSDPSPLLREGSVMGEIGEDLWVRRELRRALRDLDRVGARDAVRMRLEVPTHSELAATRAAQEGSAIS